MKQPLGDTIINSKNIQMILVPLIAYNSQNNRLGYGLNFYNNYFNNEQESLAVGLAFDFQKNDEFEVNNNDKVLDIIITNK